MVDVETTHKVAALAIQQADSLSDGAVALLTIAMLLVLVMGLGFIYTMARISKFVVGAAKAEMLAMREAINKLSEDMRGEIKTVSTEIKQLNHTLGDHHGRLVAVETELKNVERRKSCQ